MIKLILTPFIVRPLNAVFGNNIRSIRIENKRRGYESQATETITRTNKRLRAYAADGKYNNIIPPSVAYASRYACGRRKPEITAGQLYRYIDVNSRYQGDRYEPRVYILSYTYAMLKRFLKR